MLTQREKSPLLDGTEEGQTGDAAWRMTESPTHYRLSYTGPQSMSDWSPSPRRHTSSSHVVYTTMQVYQVVSCCIMCAYVSLGTWEHCGQAAGVVLSCVTNLTLSSILYICTTLVLTVLICLTANRASSQQCVLTEWMTNPKHTSAGLR